MSPTNYLQRKTRLREGEGSWGLLPRKNVSGSDPGSTPRSSALPRVSGGSSLGLALVSVGTTVPPVPRSPGAGCSIQPCELGASLLLGLMRGALESARGLELPPGEVRQQPRGHWFVSRCFVFLRKKEKKKKKKERNDVCWSWGGSGARLLNFTPKYVAEYVQLLITTTGFVKKGEKRQKKIK